MNSIGCSSVKIGIERGCNSWNRCYIIVWRGSGDVMGTR